MVCLTTSILFVSTNTFQMRFTSEEMVVLKTIVPGFRAAKTKTKRADCLAHAYIVFFSDFPIQRTVDMDEGEILWLTNQKKKVRILTFVIYFAVSPLFFSAHLQCAQLAHLELCVTHGPVLVVCHIHIFILLCRIKLYV